MVVASFLADAAQSTKAAVLLDIGANTGAWADKVMKRCSTVPRVKVMLVEPQARFREALGEIAQRWQAEVLPVALWRSSTNLTLHVPTFSEAASASHSFASVFTSKSSSVQRITVPALDAVAVLARALDGVRGPVGPVLLKYDVEGAEYETLPRLLTSGTLCRVSHLLVEWHLHSLPPHKMLAGFALRHAFDMMLTSGCSSPPRMIEHDDDMSNNFGIAVPRLRDLAELHATSSTNPGRTARFKAARAQDAQAGEMFHRLGSGFCAATLDGWAGDCEAGDSGSWPIPTEAAGTWAAASTYCRLACLSCSRCQYISFSLKHADCSWFQQCRVSDRSNGHLLQRPFGFKTERRSV